MENPDEYEQRVLYEDGKFRVAQARDIESHNLWIGRCERDKRDYVFIPRGVLREIAERGDECDSAEKFENLTQGRLNQVLASRSATVTDLILVFARARIKELDDMLY